MKVLLDATPLLGRRTGIGRYVHELLAATARLAPAAGVELAVSTWTWRGGRLDGLPPGVRQVGARVPARLLQRAWRTADLPPVELLAGRHDVVHGTNFVAPPARRAATVVTVHDLTYLDLPDTVATASRGYGELVRRALARGAHVVSPTRHVAGLVRERYDLPAERVTVTPLGVDAAWFDVQGEPPVDVPDYLVFVGSLDPRKNLPRLLDAHARLRARREDVPDLVLAGPAGRESGLAARPGVRLAGWLPDDELRALVAGARALVLPSLDEGFGLPVLEALAAGRPVLASDVPALREVGGAHVVTAAPTDADALADGLGRVLAAPDDEPARAARRAHAASFTWEACARATLEAYARAAGA